MRLRPLHPEFGVEVLGIDPRVSLPDAQIEALRAAYDAHHMLLLRNEAPLTPDQQVAFTAHFGPPVANNGQDYCTVLHNDDAAGRMRLPFHSDLTYTDAPIQGISLHALALPEGGTGTSFVSGASAWAKLPAEMQARLAVLTLRHRYESQMVVADWPEFIADHPLRLTHPRTGQPVLFITEHHAHRIIELAEADSASLIADLLARLYAPDGVYDHRWQPYDLLVWDNLALQHARSDEADPAHGERAMQRVALSDVTLDELIERARIAQALRAA